MVYDAYDIAQICSILRRTSGTDHDAVIHLAADIIERLQIENRDLQYLIRSASEDK